MKADPKSYVVGLGLLPKPKIHNGVLYYKPYPTKRATKIIRGQKSVSEDGESGLEAPLVQAGGHVLSSGLCIKEDYGLQILRQVPIVGRWSPLRLPVDQAEEKSIPLWSTIVTTARLQQNKGHLPHSGSYPEPTNPLHPWLSLQIGRDRRFYSSRAGYATLSIPKWSCGGHRAGRSN